MAKFGINDILNAKTKAAGQQAQTDGYKEIYLSPYEVKAAQENTHQKLENIEELADSFLHVGQEQPTVLARVNGEYRIIDGHRRNAANILNLERGHKEYEKVLYRFMDMSEAMYELRLLAGNGYTQELTAYEKTRLVERTKAALIRAKEEDGLEIQGKMRDLVAAMINERGTQLKIGNDIAYANYIEDKIVNEDYSPAAVLGELKAQGKEGDFSVTVCVTTLYSYIDKGIFLKLSNKNLPVKKNKKRNYKKVQRQQKRAAAGESIDKRPKEIDTREEFGNWEMDSVLGKRGKSKNTLLVLTERKTRNEIIFKLPDHTDEAVVAALDRLERKWGADMFKRVFKTITVDNGSEFADAEGLQRSIINEGEKRTKVYYCHPYSSWERGTNEVTNKMIRRKIPKGTNFDDRTEEEVESIENWINGYPRKIHGYHSAGELFEEEVKQLA